MSLRYPDDYDIIPINGPGATPLSSMIGGSTAASCAAIGDVAQDHSDRPTRRALARDAAWAALVANDPTRRRLCACGCGGELPAPSTWNGRVPAVYLTGHNLKRRRSIGAKAAEARAGLLLFTNYRGRRDHGTKVA